MQAPAAEVHCFSLISQKAHWLFKRKSAYLSISRLASHLSYSREAVAGTETIVPDDRIWELMDALNIRRNVMKTLMACGASPVLKTQATDIVNCAVAIANLGYAMIHSNFDAVLVEQTIELLQWSTTSVDRWVNTLEIKSDLKVFILLP